MLLSIDNLVEAKYSVDNVADYFFIISIDKVVVNNILFATIMTIFN